MPRPADTAPKPQPSSRPFVGRQAELDVLRGLLGRGRLVVVTGEPGMGKTRLAEEFTAEAEARGAAVRWGRSWEGEGAPAFWPWIQILRQEESEIESESDALTREIARGLGIRGRGRDSRSPIERARVSVTRAIRVAMRLIQQHDPGFGRHLAVTIKTGTYCAYVPDPELAVSWNR